MKKLIIPALLASMLTLAGCGATTSDAAKLDRNLAIAELTEQMDELGYERITAFPGIQDFLNIVVDITERQKKVMGLYRTQAENHADVQAFLYAQREATPEQLKAAIMEFDLGATTEAEKIGPKIDAYRGAIAEVSAANQELFEEILIQGAQGTYLLSQYGTEIAKATAIYQAQRLMLGGGEEQTVNNNIYLAMTRAMDQIDLATQASDLISIDQDTMLAIDALQAELEAK